MAQGGRLFRDPNDVCSAEQGDGPANAGLYFRFQSDDVIHEKEKTMASAIRSRP
jgi:hypothetical protein